ncbi:MAG: HAD-IA family hydrolase [Micromonosporaceae bacterium]|nr:HAD-IA family hydrolase [Micromonosporaceae bacterium]
MDGTLLDSERLWDTALRGLAERLGGTVSEPARRAMIGRSFRDSMAVFYRDLGLAGRDRAADDTWLAGRMAQLFATDLDWRPGAAGLVAEVRAARVPTALVTSTSRPLVEVALRSTLGTRTFDVVVCGNEVSAPKPDPESYRTAAARLGTPIARCVAIEDSPSGLASALDAGAAVVGVQGEVPLPARPGVHLVASLTDVDLTLLRRLVT